MHKAKKPKEEYSEQSMQLSPTKITPEELNPSEDENSTDTSSAGRRSLTKSPTLSPSKVTPADHVIFLVHGMGKPAIDSLEGNLKSLRKTCREVLTEEFHDSGPHIKWIPIEWWNQLHGRCFLIFRHGDG